MGMSTAAAAVTMAGVWPVRRRWWLRRGVPGRTSVATAANIATGQPS